MLSKKSQKLAPGFLTLVFILGTSGARAQTTNDALCLSGRRNIDLSAQMPPTKDQGKRGVCYVFSAAASLEAARVRNIGKAPRPISEAFLLGAFLRASGNEEIDNRVKRIAIRPTKAKAPLNRNGKKPPMKFSRTFSDGGAFNDILETAITYSGIPATQNSTQDLELLDQIDNKLTLEALEKGPNFKRRDLRGYSKKLMLKAKLRARDSELHSDFNFRSLQVKRMDMWNLKNALQDQWYTNLVNWEKGLRQLPELARWYKEKTGEELAYQSLPQMSPKEFDAFLNQASQKLNRALIKLLENRTPRFSIDPRYGQFAPVLSDLYYATRAAFDSKDQLKRSLLNRVISGSSAVPKNTLSPSAAIKELQEFKQSCFDSSELIRRAILSSLCSGIPVSLGTPGTLGMEEERKVGQKRIWEASPPRGGHAVVVTGIEQVNGEPYYIMRNSSHAVERLRMPISFSCRVSSIGIAIGPKDPGYNFKENVLVEENKRQKNERHQSVQDQN